MLGRREGGDQPPPLCRNVFHISEYGKSPEELWEQVSDEIEKRSDLTNTTVYLHGDGASWIKAGLDYLSKSRFVLDHYHKNKAIKQAVSGIPRTAGSQYEHHIRKALDGRNKNKLQSVRSAMLKSYPDREKTINSTRLDHFDSSQKILQLLDTDILLQSLDSRAKI